MTIRYSSHTSKQLVLQLVLENIDYKRRCMYLQEIISLSKANDVLTKMLTSFFDTGMKKNPLKAFCKN